MHLSNGTVTRIAYELDLSYLLDASNRYNCMITAFLETSYGYEIDQGNSIFTLAIKNRPYTTLYTTETAEPYLSLVAEIKNGVGFFNSYGCQ